MKKSFFWVLVALLIGIFLFFIPEPGENWNIQYIDSLDEIQEYNKELIYMRLKNKQGKYEMVPVYFEKKKDVYLHVMELYNERRNSLPLHYTSPTSKVFQVKQLERKDDKIIIELLHVEGEKKEFLDSLMKTYQLIGIKELEVTMDGTVYHLQENKV